MKTWLSLSPLGFLKRAIGYRSFQVAGIIQRNISNLATPTHPSNGKVAIPELGIIIDPEKNEAVLKVSTELVSLKRRQGATFKINADGALELTIGNITIVAETIQDMQIVHEIFDSWVYAMEFGEPITVWDIGANIGTASLYFAGMRGWNVLAYEPFQQTADCARRNIARNGLETKIQLTTAGIGGSTRTEQVRYNHDWRAGNGIFGNFHFNVVDPGTAVEIQILDAADEFKKVKATAGDGMIVAKIDCEGAEYEILRRLRETHDLGRISVIILEVHPIPNEDPEEAIRILIESGMSIVRREMLSKDYYMVYAARIASC
jgi:FkbM family methyltransferase